MEKSPASTTPYGKSTTVGAGDRRTREGPQGSLRVAADGRIGADKVFEVISIAMSRYRLWGPAAIAFAVWPNFRPLVWRQTQRNAWLGSEA